MKTSKQVSDYLLCRACEDRFNQGGEKWVSENCWRSETEFPLHTALSAATPVDAGPSGYKVYAGASIADVDTIRLTYFGASVFWRASVHQWGRIAGDEPVKLEFGQYEEQLRLFLVGTAKFPKDVVMVVNVNSTARVADNEYMVLPFLKDRRPTYRQYRFVVPGLGFDLFIGKAITQPIRTMCTVRSPLRFLFSSPKMEQAGLAGMARLVRKARVVGDLA